MDPAKKNPFEVFGLTPEITGRLNENDLFSLIKTLYRTLHKVYHPDRGLGKNPTEAAQSASRAVELNLAFERLNMEKDSDSFRRQHRQYAARQHKGLRKKIASLEQECQQIQDKRAALADGFMLYLLHGLPWLANNGSEPCRPHMALNNIKLGLNDVAINQNIRSVSWSLGSNYKEIVFDALGDMYYRPVGRSKSFAVNYIHLLGAIDTEKIDLIPLLDRVPPRDGCFKFPALDSRYGIDGAPLQVRNTISADNFKTHCLPLLTPDLKERAYLFSVHRPIYEQEGSVSLEGVIVKISKL